MRYIQHVGAEKRVRPTRIRISHMTATNIEDHNRYTFERKRRH